MSKIIVACWNVVVDVAQTAYGIAELCIHWREFNEDCEAEELEDAETDWYYW